jgi:2-dehydro-3-deoxyphosphogluconate aldolase/(4S)-4-hydroxy-2-oxoglutarate aldolase
VSASEVNCAIRDGRVVAILRASRPDRLVHGAQVLVEHGVRTLELPLTAPDVFDAVSETVRVVGGAAYVGVGTVRTVDDARRAVDAGATFLVAPSLNVDVVRYGCQRDVEVLPGAMTPTEIELAMRAGADLVKLFPATAHTPEFVRQVLVPMPEASVVPTGGVDLGSAAEWLQAGAVALGVGSPLTGDSLETEDWDGLAARTHAWMDAVS